MVNTLSIEREPAISDPHLAVMPGAPATAAQPSAVAWGAIIAGAVAAAAVSLILLSLGTGVGLTAASPWSGEGASAKALTVAAVIWMVVVQWISAGLGGYLTGRLRIRWSFSSDEVYFRDTAHGFLSWALAIVAIALIASTMLTSVIGGATQGAATGAAQSAGRDEGPMTAFVDTLYRSDNITASSYDVRGETTRLLTRSLATGDMTTDDRGYLTRLVVARTGLSQDQARQRVDAVITEAKTAADQARKAAAQLAIATALSLAVGAFIAAVAAGIGGHQRDD